jgi:hypothetical protein
LFNKLDSVLNPIFNRIRDSLLTPEEMRRARVLARCAEDKQFVRPADLATLSELF